MGRNSKLTDKQWRDVERRNTSGESIRSLAKEFGVNEAAIRVRINTRVKPVKALASQIAEIEIKYESLPIATQVKVRTLADELKDISHHLASAARFGAMTAHRLSGIANAQTDKIDEQDPMSNAEVIQGIVGLTKLSNAASEIGINLIRANKEAVDSLNNSSFSDMSDDDLEAEIARHQAIAG